MGNFPLERSFAEAIRLRDSSRHAIGKEVVLGDSTNLQVVDIVAVPFPMDHAEDFLDELMENNKTFLELHSSRFEAVKIWHVFALCRSETQENFCIPIERIIATKEYLN